MDPRTQRIILWAVCFAIVGLIWFSKLPQRRKVMSMALTVMLSGVLYMADVIERAARPATGREGVHVSGGHEH